MKKIYLLSSVLFIGTALFAQNTKEGIKQVTPALGISQPMKSFEVDPSRNVSCRDTIQYPLIKQQNFVTDWNNSFSGWDLWQSDADAISQTFKHTGGTSITIHGVRFYGGNSTESSIGTVTVRASIYNVDANNIPTTSVGNGTITITTTTAAYRTVTFSPALTVTGNYAVVLEATNTDGVFGLFVTDPTPGQNIDEDLSRVKSSYSGWPSGGNWLSVPALTAGFTGGPYDFEPFLAPIVSYDIATSFTSAPTTACTGTQINFTNTTTPSGILSNRMYNYDAFKRHFGLSTIDSTYAWDISQILPFSLANLTWSPNTSNTYTTSGAKDVDLYTLGGIWASCVDFATQTITVNPATDATFSYVGNTFCSGGTNPVATVTDAGTFSGSAGLNFVSTTTGEINLATTADGTYTVTYTTSGACSATSSQTVTITSAPDASFTYANAAYCVGGTNPSPVLGSGASAGVFGSTAGLSINTNTGVINLAASTAGTYTVTNSIAASGSCPSASETFSVTINAQPTATLSGGGSICAGSGNSVPVSVALTGTGPWTLSVSNGTNTLPTAPITTSPYEISVPEALAGTYTVVTVTDALCSNAGTGSVVVSVTPTPTVTAVANQTFCNGAASTAVAFTGPVSGSTFAWTNDNAAIGLGASGNGNIASFTPTNTTGAAITATITVTPTANGCVGTPSTFTITVNPSPAVTFTAPGTVCVYNSSFALTPGTPAGGTFSGTGVTGSNFDPATAGLGTHTVTYAVTAGGCPGSATSNIVVSACASIEDIIANDGLAIYPNPSTGNVTFEFANGSDVNLSIVSTEGKTVYQNNFQTTQATVDLSSLAKGTYFVRVTMNGKTSTAKLVLNK